MKAIDYVYPSIKGRSYIEPTLLKSMEKIDTVLPLSGGIDSTYCLYWYLKEHPDKNILLHHLRMNNFEGRMDYELKATLSILEWLDSNGYKDRYIYIESGFDYGDINYVNQDIVTVGYVTGTILRDPKWKRVTKNMMTTCWDEQAGYDFGNPKSKLRKTHTRKILTIKIAADRNDIELTYPSANTTKGEMLEYMPDDLARLCWYCRRPTEEGKVCGKCATCRRVQKYVKV